MEKYYFEQYYGTCKQLCSVKKDGTMIGSLGCQTCKYLKQYDKKLFEWIICVKIKNALQK